MSIFADTMKQKQGFIYILMAFCAVCLAVVKNLPSEDVMSESIPKHIESSLTSSRQQQPHEATLSDAAQLYRICSSRPLRILPTLGSRSKRIVSPFSHPALQCFVKPLHSYFDSRCRMETAPFRLPASCDYYVIALRHIIC